MNGLETIGLFSVVILITGFMWFMLFMISSKEDGDDDAVPYLFASIITIVMLIILLSMSISEYIGDERKIDEYKEKLSTYEKMEVEDESGN